MERPVRLVVFDVDGTLVDSQADILGAMALAFEVVGLEMPTRAEVLGIVGLSLPVAMAHLAPDSDADKQARLVEGYKSAYTEMRARIGAAHSSPLYPGARAMLETLNDRSDLVLGVATGKSKRGLDKLVEAHGLERFFATRQVADFHPSKPHPSMLLQAMDEVGVAPQDTVMIGDTSFDMEMAAAAGVHGIGVTWGYHPETALRAANTLVADFDALHITLSEAWGRPQ